MDWNCHVTFSYTNMGYTLFQCALYCILFCEHFVL